MGCNVSKTSVPDPNVMYGYNHPNITKTSTANNNNSPSKSNGKNKVHPFHNGHVTFENGINRPKTPMRGDLEIYKDAKKRRRDKLRESQRKREMLGQEMSDKIMDENERLSLTSSRSRATSRATSPRGGGRTVRSLRHVEPDLQCDSVEDLEKARRFSDAPQPTTSHSNNGDVTQQPSTSQSHKSDNITAVDSDRSKHIDSGRDRPGSNERQNGYVNGVQNVHVKSSSEEVPQVQVNPSEE